MHDMSQVSEGIVVNGQISGAVVEANRNALAAAFVRGRSLSRSMAD